MFIFECDDIIEDFWCIDDIFKKKSLTNMEESGFIHSRFFKNRLKNLFLEHSNDNTDFIFLEVNLINFFKSDYLERKLEILSDCCKEPLWF